MKKIQLKQISFYRNCTILLACSTKKDNYVNRKWHETTNTKYNVLYSRFGLAEKGIAKCKKQLILIIFGKCFRLKECKLQKEEQKPGDTKNPNFERAETKATKSDSEAFDEYWWFREKQSN